MLKEHSIDDKSVKDDNKSVKEEEKSVKFNSSISKPFLTQNTNS